LTLISAPAGFGKTTLLAEWLGTPPAGEPSIAWLSLDEADNEAGLFWTYVLTALERAASGVATNALSLLRTPQPPPTETILATLLNELGTAPNHIVLVLDDYHVIGAPDIQDGMAFLLEHLPAHTHLVIATRADPALPLSRLRAGGELVEIRAVDLRFTPDEAAAYLNEVMGLALGASDVAALEARTEGWIAALQLAALSMQGREDVAGFIASFAGDDRYIVDYLVEEVLQRQPEGVRNFLLQTSILERLSGPLCDAITGQHGGRGTLEALDRGNLFLVPLDDRREWYRYHHLFADVLRARLLDEQPGHVPELHRRASDWYEQNSARSEAIHHAMAGQNFERAADLIELAIPAMAQGRHEATARRWLEVLPEELFRFRPVLSIGHVGALMVSGDLEARQRELVERRLRDAERWLDDAAGSVGEPELSSPGMVVVDEEQFRRLPSAVAVYRAAQARILGDLAGTIAHAQRALDLVGDDDHLGRGSAAGFLALTYWTSGDLEAGHRHWVDAMESLLKAGHVSDAIGCGIPLGDIRVAQGRLRDAMTTYERGLQLATGRGGPVLRGAADMHVGVSELLRERGDLETAAWHLVKAQQLGEDAGLAQHGYRWRVAMAQIRHAAGDVDGALALLDEAERAYVSEYYPNLRPVGAVRARIWAASGQLDEAAGWARDQRLSVDDALSYLREFEHITFARVLMAQSERERPRRSVREVLALLKRLLEAAERGQRRGSVLEISVLQAVTHQRDGDSLAALLPLRRALSLAETEGYVRIFLDEGPSMAALLTAAARQGIAPDYVRLLLGHVGAADAAPHGTQGLIEPLTEREVEVLRLLATDLDGPKIASELVVSLSTVRTHTKNLYAKLGVNNRRAAVRRGARLGLLSRPADR
jgi:LuxR family maltose regulon positive regulatory protein